MSAIRSRTFKSGSGVALRLPSALGIAAGVEMRIEKAGDSLIIRPARDAAAEKAKVNRLVETLAALPVPGETPIREPIEFPTRRGLV
jgi:virulence-associated protein VagC